MASTARLDTGFIQGEVMIVPPVLCSRSHRAAAATGGLRMFPRVRLSVTTLATDGTTSIAPTTAAPTHPSTVSAVRTCGGVRRYRTAAASAAKPKSESHTSAGPSSVSRWLAPGTGWVPRTIATECEVDDD